MQTFADSFFGEMSGPGIFPQNGYLAELDIIILSVRLNDL